MSPSCRWLHEQRRGDRGFTLLELLVVMTVVGVLAGIALPTMLSQRRNNTYEASAKQDVRAITREVLAQFVDDSGALAVSGSDGTWTLVRDGSVVATGALSAHNVVSAASFVTAGGDYCLPVVNTKVDAQYWTADDSGLRAGDCPP